MSKPSISSRTVELPDLPALTELKSRPQWVAWSRETRNGRSVKIPVNPLTGTNAASDDPRTWGTYAQACKCARTRRLAGIGYMFGADDDVSGLDLDGCIDGDGRLEPWAAAVVGLNETYAERSPSGRGIHFIARGKLPKAIVSAPAGVEIYSSGRYFAMTGDHIEGTPTEIGPAPKTLAMLQEHVAAFKAPPKERPKSQSRGETFFGRANSLALANLAAWVPAIFGADAEPAGTGGYRVSSASLGRDLQEALSFHPSGIVDFGVHDMGDEREGKRTPIDIVIEHGADVVTDIGHEPDAMTAARWLCEQLDVDPGELERPNAADEFPEAFFGKRFHLVAFNDLKLQTKNRYLVKGLIPGTGLVVVWGPPKGGKSFWVGDVMLHVAQGWDYRGRKVARGTVVYCAMEGAAGYGARFEAMRQQYKIASRAHVPLYLLATPMKLVRDRKTLIDDIKTHLGDRSPPVAIVLDTLNRSITGSESSDADMSDYLAAADALWTEFGCAVILVHHCGWDETRPRGHTSLPGAIEAQIAVKRDGPREGGKFTATVELMKDGREGDVIQSRLEVVRVGTDDDGEPITTCVVQPTGGDEFEQTPLTPAAEQMWEAFQVAAKEGGGLEDWRITPVSTDAWEQTYCNLFDITIKKSTPGSGTTDCSAAGRKAITARYVRDLRQDVKDSGRVKKDVDDQWVAL